MRLSIRELSTVCLRCVVASFVTASVFGINLHAAGGKLSELENTMDRWIELEQQIAVAENQWKPERVLLLNTATALAKEQASLKRNLESHELANRLFQTNLLKTNSEVNRIELANDQFASDIEALEGRMRKLSAVLPEPLIKIVDPLVRRMGKGEGDSARSLAERSQNVMAMLSSIGQFANNLTLTHSLRTNPSDRGQFDVEVLYWGLAIGFATDAKGDRGWILKPGDSGWTWEAHPDRTQDIKKLIDVYKKQREPALVTLPVSIRNLDE